MRQQHLHDAIQARQPHVEHGGGAGHRERPPIGLRAVTLPMTGNERHAVRMFAMRQRNTRVRRCPQRRGDAGHHRKIDARRRERLQLFPAAPEDERIAALEAHHALALVRVLDEQRVDLLLRAADIAGRFAHADALRHRAARDRAPRAAPGDRAGSHRHPAARAAL